MGKLIWATLYNVTVFYNVILCSYTRGGINVNVTHRM